MVETGGWILAKAGAGPMGQAQDHAFAHPYTPPLYGSRAGTPCTDREQPDLIFKIGFVFRSSRPDIPTREHPLPLGSTGTWPKICDHGRRLRYGVTFAADVWNAVYCFTMERTDGMHLPH
jgi:hypothetical protein